MEVSRVGWWYGDTIGFSDHDLQTAAGHTVAWAMYSSDCLTVERFEMVTVRIYLRLTHDEGMGGVVYFDYPAVDAMQESRSPADKAHLFEHALAVRVPMDRYEARDWWNENVFGYFQGNPFPGSGLFTSRERPAPPNPHSFLMRLMEARELHALNAQEADQYELAEGTTLDDIIDEIEEATERMELEPEPEPEPEDEVVATPGVTGLTEDVPVPPPLPSDHPLNADDEDVPTDVHTPLFMGTNPVVDPGPARHWVHDYVVHLDTDLVLQARITEASQVLVSNGETGRITQINQNYDPGQLRNNIAIYFRITTDYPNPPLEGDWRVVLQTNSLTVLPVAARPAVDESTFMYRIEPALGDCAGQVAVYAHPDNGHMVLGLFFVPPTDLPDDWRDRAQGWAALNWTKPGMCLRFPAPTDTRMRNNPATYIPTLVNALLRGRISFLREEWGVNPNSPLPPVPPWLRNGIYTITGD